jgi:hypothetical protein
MTALFGGKENGNRKGAVSAVKRGREADFSTAQLTKA